MSANKYFWEQYTYGKGTEEYGAYDSIDEALLVPFISRNTEGRDLMIQTGPKTYKSVVHQKAPYEDPKKVK